MGLGHGWLLHGGLRPARPDGVRRRASHHTAGAGFAKTLALALLLSAWPLSTAAAQDGAADPPAAVDSGGQDAGGGGAEGGADGPAAGDPAPEGGEATGGEGPLTGEPEAPAGPSIVIVPRSDSVPRAGGLRPPVEGEQPAEATAPPGTTPTPEPAPGDPAPEDADASADKPRREGARARPERGAAAGERGEADPAAEGRARRATREGGRQQTESPLEGFSDVDAATRLEVRAKVLAEESEKAVAFAEALGPFLTQELEVQEYERSTLGAEDITKLGGHRLKRRTRIDLDAAEFVALAGGFARRALAVPRPTPGVHLNRDQLAFVQALHKFYEDTRDIQRIKSITERNAEFRATANWQVRDQAVRLRDELVDIETTLTALIDETWLFYTGDIGLKSFLEMQAELTRIAPEALAGGGDLATLVLTNEALQQQVIAEVSSILKSPREPLAPAASADELRQSIGPLYVTLLDVSGVMPIYERQQELTAQLAEVDAKLEDMGVNTLTPPERRAITREKATIEQQLLQASNEWRATEPDRKTANALIAAQDDLLRKEQYDLGPVGALFAHRYDEVRAMMDPALLDEGSVNIWLLLEAQAALLNEINASKPEPSLLADLSPPRAPTISQAALMASLGKKVPQPKPGKGKGKGKPKGKKKPPPR